jgi:hypothetical protein
MRASPSAIGTPAIGLLLFAAAPAPAASHLWRINEVMSSADGSIQFIELKECCGALNERYIAGKHVTSDATGNVFTIPSDLPCFNCTANKHLLLATPAFAALPGAPVPDFIIPAGFFSISGDTLRYAPEFNYDDFPFPDGALPTDGLNSIHVTDYTTNAFTTGLNSPTNFAGQTGVVCFAPPTGNLNGDASVDSLDIDRFIAALLGPATPMDICAADFNGNTALDLGDVPGLVSALLAG